MVANSAEKRYVVDRGTVFAETDASGNITAYYVYGLGLVSKITPDGHAYFYHYDGVGSTTAMTDISGNIVNKYAYDEFGNVLKSEETIPNPFKYVGRYGVMDDGNGLYNMRARYYDPKTGRFISEDPIGLAGGINKFAYSENNSVNWIDPTGLRKWGVIATGGVMLVQGAGTAILGGYLGSLIVAAEVESGPVGLIAGLTEGIKGLGFAAGMISGGLAEAGWGLNQIGKGWNDEPLDAISGAAQGCRK